ncbi:ribosome biogenesis GTP-binding protein YihA/YsxC [Mycoplasmopsis felis]|uniref:ribosome biogenesis GTP-binding protein YihA/YsxC n=1 Tax=Mycoplasmopsis felis TaxID=33923 RepID=UPI002AF6AF98|nr:ribosome biogenesis GTP-binding protein YihA/YsxC [Mycoplasmopsis felis]WQQ01872.1 ribosome biogenesis GTP-binding protein YihA/YsxC [Mycoplasmopsis felis]WQQ03611.1 ribosome biogenesis GTP-binding protein YihA/YsxC [Mycoplasmopsis felis]WQQ07222.1 ribosome biogenesis GTP-binding protein YihA/YsxC [Mycoplasmopsis felis]WQQ07810.1 ribosome biogenesis GTP-binding protein YihA/YsxC [Mycoplasmopsis felis]WRX06463.1 ribosome biogenesis GTP-binding protein YihA/YsxC [Mycoplasmopsis felis]
MFKFIKSSNKIDNWYNHPNPEIAFWGRSNVGKSSLINRLTNNHKIARVSKKPGRTQMINFFENSQKNVFVDLPGYGYAQLSQSKINEITKMIEEYLTNRTNLFKIYLLIDSRLGITKNDENTILYLQRINLPFVLIYTKYDKLNQRERNILNNKIKNDLVTFNIKKYFIISSENGFGIENLKNEISNEFGVQDEK